MVVVGRNKAVVISDKSRASKDVEEIVLARARGVNHTAALSGT